MILNVNSMLCRQLDADSDDTAEAGITRFSIALYLSHLHVEFDDEIRGILRISSIISG